MAEEVTISLQDLPVVYEAGEPKSVIVDIGLFRYMLNRLAKQEDMDLFADPEVIQGLLAGQADLEAGRVVSMTDLIAELGLEDELRP